MDYAFAARLNSFKVNPDKYWIGKNDKVTVLDVLERAAFLESSGTFQGFLPAGIEVGGHLGAPRAARPLSRGHLLRVVGVAVSVVLPGRGGAPLLDAPRSQASAFRRI